MTNRNTIDRRTVLGSSLGVAGLSVLAACGGGDSGSAGGSLKILGQGAAWTKGDFWWSRTDEYMKQHPGTKVAIVSAGQKFKELFSSQVAAGTFPDILAGQLDLSLMLQHDWVQSFDGDLGIQDAKNRFPKNMWVDGITTADEKIYSYTPLDNRGVFLQYNTELLKKAGISQPPGTWDDLISMAQKVSAVVPGVQGFAAPLKTQNGYDFFSSAYTAAHPTIEGGFDYHTGQYSTDQQAKAIAIIVKLKQAGVLHNDVLSLDAAQSDGLFSNGKVAFSVTGSWSAAVNLRAKMTDFGVTWLPTDGESPLLHGTLAQGQLWVSKDANKEATKQLVEFYLSEDSLKGCVTDLRRPAADPQVTKKYAEVDQLVQIAELQSKVIQPPVPTAANPKALAVQTTEGTLPEPRTAWWHLAQGAVAGKVPDWSAKLDVYQQAMNDRFSKALAKESADRSLFTFADWDGTSNYDVKQSVT